MTGLKISFARFGGVGLGREQEAEKISSEGFHIWIPIRRTGVPVMSWRLAGWTLHVFIKVRFPSSMTSSFPDRRPSTYARHILPLSFGFSATTCQYVKPSWKPMILKACLCSDLFPQWIAKRRQRHSRFQSWAVTERAFRPYDLCDTIQIQEFGGYKSRG